MFQFINVEKKKKKSLKATWEDTLFEEEKEPKQNNFFSSHIQVDGVEYSLSEEESLSQG